CSNNYLGLADHPRLLRAAKEAIDRYGTSAVASRLVSGTMTLHEELEAALARFKGTQAALVFNCGYMANVGIVSSLLGPEDVVFSDELNHASIIDGCRLSRARVVVFPHKDMNALEALLKREKGRRRMIVVDGVFSMDGDIAPLPDMVELAEDYGALLMVDEAHGTGVLGERGAGTVEHFGLTDRVPIQMGTLGKALGGFGAYVAGSDVLREYLINRARSFIFTTALPPADMAVALEAVRMVWEEPQRRRRLHQNVVYLVDGLKSLGFQVTNQGTAIIPVIIGPEDKTMDMSTKLLEYGVFVAGIRPPTVPPGTSRLRVTVMATHAQEDLDKALEAFERAGKEVGVI
ncbi:MAG TPA: 8-amino-7-oxononanoate synthase, partial [Thermosulfidibacter takaii]|nr:8-amino-7-oxononanoate synthase [Thermosulfidibacter takaii]